MTKAIKLWAKSKVWKTRSCCCLGWFLVQTATLVISVYAYWIVTKHCIIEQYNPFHYLFTKLRKVFVIFSTKQSFYLIELIILYSSLYTVAWRHKIVHFFNCIGAVDYRDGRFQISSELAKSWWLNWGKFHTCNSNWLKMRALKLEGRQNHFWPMDYNSQCTWIRSSTTMNT